MRGGPGRATVSTLTGTDATSHRGRRPGASRVIVRAVEEHPYRPDDEREVPLVDEEPILPDQTRDDTDAGWGERSRGNEDRLLDERPPHWE